MDIQCNWERSLLILHRWQSLCFKVTAVTKAFILIFSVPWNFSIYFQIKSSDYCDGVFGRLKYPNSYDYIFNLVFFFIISLEGNHFRSSGSMSALQQNSQTSKEIRVDISIFVGHSIQSSFFGILCNCLDHNLCCFLSIQLWHTMSSQLDISRLQDKPKSFFSSKKTHAPTRHLHQQETLDFCSFIQA